MKKVKTPPVLDIKSTRFNVGLYGELVSAYCNVMCFTRYAENLAINAKRKSGEWLEFRNMVSAVLKARFLAIMNEHNCVDVNVNECIDVIYNSRAIRANRFIVIK